VPSPASGLPLAKRSKKPGPPEPTTTAVRAPGIKLASVSVVTGAHAASNAAAASGTTTFSPTAPSARSSAARTASSPVDVVRAFGYFSWNGYGVEKPSDGGKDAVFTAASTHVPVGVPANLPVTSALVTLPFLPMTMLTIAVPGTLNWL